MMNRLRIGCLCIMISLFAAGLQAAPVTWDVGLLAATGSYSIPFGYNGGTFYYLTSPSYSNIQYGRASILIQSEPTGFRHHNRNIRNDSWHHRILCHGGRWNPCRRCFKPGSGPNYKDRYGRQSIYRLWGTGD